jgi:hypothetical protein
MEKVLGRRTRDHDQVFVIVLQHFGSTCPAGQPTHDEGAKSWRD